MLVRWHIVVAQERGVDMNEVLYNCIIYPEQIYVSVDTYKVPIKDWLHNIIVDAVKDATKHGEWIRKPDKYSDLDCYVCSECGHEKICLTKYCPNCGSEMKEVKW